MAHQIIGIDRLLISVGDVDEAGAAFSRLGFALSRSPDGEGGANRRSLVFANARVDLIDGARSSQSARLAGLGLASRDLAATRRSLSGVDVALPPTTTTLPAGLLPGVAMVHLAEDGRPDAPRHSDGNGHPNKATGIVSVTILLDEPEAAIPAYNRLFGPAACTTTDALVTVHTGRGLIFLVDREGFDDLHPGLDLPLPPAPACVAMTIGVADRARAAWVLDERGVTVTQRGDHLCVPTRDSLGIGLELVEG